MFLKKPNQHVRLISERSCDTKDWSNDAENSAIHNRNKIYFKIYSNREELHFCCIFDRIYAALVRTKDF